jgi:flagellar basal body P-ring formation protein FlgA
MKIDPPRFSFGLRPRFIRSPSRGEQRPCAWKFSFLIMLSVCFAFGSQAEEPDPHAPYQLLLEDIEKAVSDALVKADVAKHVRATVTNNRDKVLYAGSQPAHVELRTLTYDKGKSSWSANMLIMDGEKVLTAKPITGRYNEEQALPVLKQRFRDNDVIAKEHIEMQFFPITKVRQDTVLEVEELIGKSPRHMISPNRPIRTGELTTPPVLEKGATVSMRYVTPYMSITTTGEAQEEGSVGDVIRVLNPDSKKIVRARITSPQEVTVGVGQ